jgi:hypothetical protein
MLKKNLLTACILILGFFLFQSLECPETNIVDECPGGVSIVASRNLNQPVPVWSNVSFNSDYTGAHQQCWIINGRCDFNPGTRTISFGPNCTGNYDVRLEIRSGGQVLCQDEVSFQVFAAACDTCSIGIPNPVQTFVHCP